MLGLKTIVIGSAVLSTGARIAAPYRANKNDCLRLTPNQNTFPSTVISNACNEMYGHCGKIDHIGMHLNQDASNMECTLYDLVKQGQGDGTFATRFKLNIITMDLLRKIERTPNEKLKDLIKDTIDNINRLKTSVDSSKSVLKTFNKIKMPLTSDGHTLSEDHKNEFYGKGGTLERKLTASLDEQIEGLEGLLNETDETIKNRASAILKKFNQITEPHNEI